MDKANTVVSLPAKIVACVLVVACLAVGVVGLVLPIIPGLLFLAVAAFIAVRYFPSVDARLRRHRAMGKHLDRVDRFRHLSLLRKMQIAGLLCVKMLIDSLAFVGSKLARLAGRGH